MVDLRTQTRAWDVPLVVALTLTLQMGISAISAATPILAPAMAADRGWSVTLVALYPVAIYGTAFVFSFHIPSLLARIGGIGLATASLAISAFGLVFLLPESPFFIIIVVLSLGFAVGAMNPASAQILGARVTPRNTGLIMSIKSTGIPLGVMLAGAIIPPFIARFGWHHTIAAIAVSAFVLSVSLWPLIRQFDHTETLSRAPQSRRSLDSIRRLMTIPGMMRFLLSASAFAAGRDCLRTFYVVYLVDHVGMTLIAAGFALSVSQAAGVLGQIVWASASDRLLSTSRTMIVVGTLITLAISLTALMSAHWPSAWIMSVAGLYGLSAGGFFPLVLAEIARRCTDGDAGPLTAAAQIVMIPITLVGPLLFGLVASLASLPAAFLVLAGCTCVGTIVAARYE